MVIINMIIGLSNWMQLVILNGKIVMVEALDDEPCSILQTPIVVILLLDIQIQMMVM